VGTSLISINSIEHVERVLDQATALQIEAKGNIRNVILLLEESATKLRWITSKTNPPTAASIAFGNELAEIERAAQNCARQTGGSVALCRRSHYIPAGHLEL
jgi:hypothetical protein